MIRDLLQLGVDYDHNLTGFVPLIWSRAEEYAAVCDFEYGVGVRR